MSQVALDREKVPPLFSIPLRSIPPNRSLPFNVYIFVAEKPAHLRTPGDSLTGDRIKQLHRHNINAVYIPEDERELYRQFLWDVMTDHSASAEQRASCMREAAHLEATVLYSSQDLGRQLPKTIELYTQHGHLAIEVQPPTLSELVPLIVHEELQQQHAVNTSVYCMALTRLIYGNDERKIALIGVAGLVHDIGETRVPKQLLEKDLTLTGEWEETKRHCQYGLDIVDKIDSVPAEVRAAIGQHHENFAGEGYPNNLKGEQIDPAARIVSICDIFDMLTTTRPDHDALTPAEALKLMDSMQPGRFDPQMFARFIKNG